MKNFPLVFFIVSSIAAAGQNAPKENSTFKSDKDKAEAGINHRLVAFIDSMANEDQRNRKTLIDLINKEVAATAPERLAIVRKLTVNDSLNYHACRNILNRYGFPNYNLVGRDACHSFWLLVQHQDTRVAFQDSVLQKMKPEVDKNLASSLDYAYLTDRVKINAGQLQVYGTQMQLNKEQTSYEPEPVTEPGKLNERRRSVGLGSIEDYIHTMNTTYPGSLKK